jgi:hypothetical protein
MGPRARSFSVNARFRSPKRDSTLSDADTAWRFRERCFDLRGDGGVARYGVRVADDHDCAAGNDEATTRFLRSSDRLCLIGERGRRDDRCKAQTNSVSRVTCLSSRLAQKSMSTSASALPESPLAERQSASQPVHTVESRLTFPEHTRIRD